MGGNYFCFKGIGPERGERGSSFNLISIRSGAGKTAEVGLWLEVRVGTGTPTVPSPAASVCVGIFTLLLYRLVFPLGGGGGGGGGRVPGCVLRPLDQIVIAHDCARRCLCVSVRGADRAPSLGVLIPNGRVRTGV